MALRIRPASPSDLASLEPIETAADRLLVEWLRPDAWPPAVTGASRATDGFLLVAEEQETGGLVGFAHVLEGEGFGHLEQISVLPEHGRRGYGRSLLEAAKATARERGLQRLTLRTYADVPWNAPFYAAAGFVVEDPSTPFHRALVDAEARLGLDRYGRRVQMGADLAGAAGGGWA